MDSDSVEIAWLQMPEEPEGWYNRFVAYYLPLGPTRNLTRAYLKFLATNNPKQLDKVNASGNIVSGWSEHANLWHWRERADAFDLYNASESFAYVDKARNILLQGTEAAAQALVENLKSPRLAVAAAKEILDRGGLPGTHLLGVGRVEPYTADDLHKAEKEVAEWEKQIRGDIVIIDANPDPVA